MNKVEDLYKIINPGDGLYVECYAMCSSNANNQYAGVIALYDRCGNGQEKLIVTGYIYNSATVAINKMEQFCSIVRRDKGDKCRLDKLIQEHIRDENQAAALAELMCGVAEKHDDKVIIVPELHENITDIWSCLVTMYHDEYKVASFSIAPEGNAASRKETAVAYTKRIIESIQGAEIVVKDDD